MRPNPAPAILPADRETLRALAGQVAAIAALPEQEVRRARWRNLNALRPERPLVVIDQICWHELEAADPEALALRCTDPECRAYESRLRQTLYQWRHFPVDMVVEPWIGVSLAVHNSGFGIGIDEEVRSTDAASSVRSHAYRNQLSRDEDLELVRMPQVTHDRAESDRRMERAQTLFAGILEPVPQTLTSYFPYLSIWDPISTWMGAEQTLLSLTDRSDFMHALADRMCQGYLGLLDQLEQQGLLLGPQPTVHCSGAWTDALPAQRPGPHRCAELWSFGLAQVLGSASPRMFRAFEVEHIHPIAARFGLVYYGCCEPLHGKMAEVRRIPNVRKVSMSPWVDERRGAAAIGRDFVFSRKPNPAHLAMTGFSEELVRDHLRATRTACSEHGCPLEYILKDISTICYKPERLFAWARIAMEVAQG